MDYSIETWRPVVEWEGLYEVSSHGRVRSLDRVVRCGYGKTRTHPGKLMRPWPSPSSYPVVALVCKGRPERRTFIHILVCEAFHGPKPSELHEVAHRDGSPANGRADNLRWATHAENEADKIEHGTRTIGERHGMAKLTAEQILAIRADPRINSEVAKDYPVSRDAINQIRKRRTWRHLEAA